MKTLSLILALVVLSTAQKHKHAKHGKAAYVAASPGSSHNQGGEQYHQGGPSQNEQPIHYGGGQGSSVNYGSGKAAAKHTYPQLLADTRTLNTDGTINFNFQADNGLNQGETVDPDGTRRGFYSYPGADGKVLTVKYTAGKNGFVAEGDHLPMQPQSASHSEKDESYVPKTRHGRQEHDDGQYRPGTYGDDNGNQGDSGQYNRPSHGSSGGQYSGGSSPAGPSGGSSGLHHSSPYSGQGGSGGSSYSSVSEQGPQTHYSGAGSPSHGGRRGAGRPYSGGAGRFPGGSPSYSSVSSPSHGGGSGGPSYNSAPSYSSFGGGQGGSPGGGGFMYSAANPYQPTDGAAPFNGAFDLGNSGHFAINFNPGSSQEYNPGGQQGGFGGGQTSSQSYGGGSPSGRVSHGSGARGQY